MSATSPLPALDDLDLDAELTRHRGPLIGFCYRMLGSTFEAEDAVQETMLRAWRSFEQYEGRASFKSWLYRIATNVCFDLLAGRRRRAMPMDLSAPSAGDQPVGDPAGDVLWLQPIPDRLVSADPADVATRDESIRLAFVAALQHLQPRQRAVLILRDVLAWHATEVAELLDMTPTSVHSMLRRAREAIAHHGEPDSTAAGIDTALLDRYVEAFAHHDIDAFVALLRDDAEFSMPPNRLWLLGPAEIRRFYMSHSELCSRMRYVPTTAANGSGALGMYQPADNGTHVAFAIQVIESQAGRIAGIHTFIEPALFPVFGLSLVVA
jgi:RNA polymerase sigma-70 factor (ECF subfamily)